MMSDTYSTQFLLLFSQIVHEACIVVPTPESFVTVVKKLNEHPIVRGTLLLDSDGLSELYSRLLHENDITLDDIGQGLEGKRPPDFATKLCEVYYFERMEELKREIKENEQLFNEQVTEFKSVK